MICCDLWSSCIMVKWFNSCRILDVMCLFHWCSLSALLLSEIFLPQFLFAVLAAETGFVKNEFISCHSFHWVNWFQTGWACFLSCWLKLQSHKRVNTPLYHMTWAQKLAFNSLKLLGCLCFYAAWAFGKHWCKLWCLHS